MKRLLIASFLLAPLFASSQQVAKSLTASNGTFIGFYQYTPTDYNSNPTTQYPLIIFLHGIGERGDGQTNLPLVLANGIPKNIANGHPMRFFWNGKWETFLVLSPQLSTAYGDWQNFYVDEMIKYAKNNLRVDPNRIYLTGLSLGGGGVWRYASSSSGNASQLAAIAPVCGTCGIVSAANIAGAKLPVWAFHAQDDGVVGVGCTTSAIQAIQAAGNPVKPIMTLYPSGGHWIWDRAYDTDYNWANPNLYEWLLGQNKSLGVNTLPVANAGADITISSVLGSASLDGSSSYDADGNIVRYIWNKVSGPSVGNIASPVTINGITSLTGLITAGTYVFELTVVDNRGGISKDQVVVNVTLTGGGGPGNVAPVAKAGPDQSITLPANSVTLNGSGSSDADGNIISYNWTKVSGGAATISAPNAAITSISGLVQGNYVFSLTVTDNAGATNTSTVKVTVNGSSATNKIPVVVLPDNPTITLPTNSVWLSGSSSYDMDGTITSWNWTKVSGDTATFSAPNSANTTITGLKQGSYTFALTITDNNGASASKNIVVTVNTGNGSNGANKTPVVVLPDNPSVSLPATSIWLSGSSSYDMDGSIVSWSWSKTSGNPVTFSSATSANTTVSGLQAGTYTFALTIIDNAGASSTGNVTVTVKDGSNKAPVANAGPDQVLSTSSVSLSGSQSYDPDGTIVSYKWNKISGPTQYSFSNTVTANSTVSNLVTGLYQFELTVTDNQGSSSKDTIQVTISATQPAPLPLSPVANAGSDVNIVLPTNSVVLNGLASSAPAGFIANWNWLKIGGPAEGSISSPQYFTTSVVNLVKGTYTFVLSIKDNLGSVAYDTVIVNVRDNQSGNLAPIADAGPDQSIQLPSNSVVLKGLKTTDPDGFIANWLWTKIDGPASGVIASPNYFETSITNLVQGRYVFALTVTDNNGNKSSDSVVITVASSNQSGANAGSDFSLTMPYNYGQLNGLSSTPGTGSYISTWKWSQLSGPNAANISSPNYAIAGLSGLVAGQYQFQLKIVNDLGQESSDTVTVTVNNFPQSSRTGLVSQQISESSAVTAIQEKLVAYPNPATTQVTLRYSSSLNGPSKANVYDINGRLVYSYQFVKQSASYDVTVPLSSLTAGIYYAEVLTGNIKLTSRFVKQ